MTAREIEKRIAVGLPQSRVEVRDTTGGGDHFEVLVISPEFSGKTMLERHRMVYSILGDAMKAEVHALALRTLNPEEWERRSRGEP